MKLENSTLSTLTLEETFILGKKIKLFQPKDGYKSGIDPIFLAYFADVKTSDVVFDFGCGVGASTFAVEFFKSPKLVKGFEIQECLAELFLMNAKENNSKITISNMCISKIKETADVIIMNPPYYNSENFISPENDILKQANMESDIGLFEWLFCARRCLKPKGKLSIVHRTDRLDDILHDLKKLGFGGISIIPLWPKLGKPSKRMIVNAIKNSKKPLSLSPGLIIHAEESYYTPQAEDILRGNIKSLLKEI